MEGNERVADFVTEVGWDDLPSAVQDIAHLALMDTLGTALAGTLTPISRVTTEYAERTWPGDEATIFLHGRRSSAVGAAFTNGYAANGIDIDDCGLYTKGHPGAQIVPTALAVGEAQGLGGAEVLTSIVVGYEVAHRAARIWHETHDVYQACGSWGSMACAAVAAHLMELNPEQTYQALGIADYHAPNLPMMRDIDHPTMVKHGIGWGAMNGIVSAQLAERGFTTIPSLLGLDEYRDWVADIGRHYLITDGLAWKRYACCAWDHAAILALAQLMSRHTFDAEDVAQVRVETFHEAVRLGTDLPSTTEEAQFSLAWPLAAFIVDGEVGPAQILEEALHRDDIREVANKIEAIESEKCNELYRLASKGDPRGRYVSKVEVDLHDGRTVETDWVEGEINFPQRTWDEQSLERKFRWLSSYVLDDQQIDQLVDAIQVFACLSDIGTVTALVAG